MLQVRAAFSGFSVHDLSKVKVFYTQTLGLKLAGEEMGLQLELPGGGQLFIYEKKDHQAATYTVLNLVVDDIDAAVDTLAGQDVQFERYPDMHQDEKGIARGRASGYGPDIAWFKDPDGNILSVLQSDNK